MVRRASKTLHKGPLTDEEVADRIYKQIQIIDDEANKEINMMSVQSPESREVLSKEIAAEPKELIDEWVEKLRAYTERHTLIHSARLRRIAKLRVLDAFGDIREVIKSEARERIKEKMTGNSKECDELLGRMLYQGLVRLMEHTVLVHTTRADIKKVEKHYAWASKKYYDETNVRVKLVTSKHPLKSSYYGRIVLSDKKSTMFVDVNLHRSVDRVADEVFTQLAAIHGKYKNPMVLEMKALRVHGFEIMPRGPGITSTRLDIIISTMHGDPRTQVPMFCVREESRKQIQTDSSAVPQPTRTNRRKVTIPFISTPQPGIMANQAEPIMSVVPAKYMFRQQEDTSDETSRTSRDLYNLESGVSSIELTADTATTMVGQSAIWKNMPTKAKAMVQNQGATRVSRTAARGSPKNDPAPASESRKSAVEQKPAQANSKSSSNSPQVSFKPSEDSSIGPNSLESGTFSSRQSSKER